MLCWPSSDDTGRGRRRRGREGRGKRGATGRGVLQLSIKGNSENGNSFPINKNKKNLPVKSKIE